jgi:hypothetical protein
LDAVKGDLLTGGIGSSATSRGSIPSRTWHRCAALAAATILVAMIGFLAPGRAHATDCSAVHKQVEGQDSENWFFLGYRATILVNDFGGDYQCDTNRSIFMYANANNWAELGWVELGGPPHIVYWNRRSDGETHEHPTGHTPSGGTDQQFKIVNENGNHYWRFLYNGDPLEDSPGYVANSDMGFALNNSEKHGASDNLFAHYDNQQICLTITYCNFENPGNFQAGGNSTGNPPGWVWCKDSNAERHVRQNNCS